jgi:hypothetical protein
VVAISDTARASTFDGSSWRRTTTPTI